MTPYTKYHKTLFKLEPHEQTPITDTETLIKNQIADNAVLLYERRPNFRVWLSARAVEVLTNRSSICVVNILENPEFDIAQNCQLAYLSTALDKW